MEAGTLDMLQASGVSCAMSGALWIEPSKLSHTLTSVTAQHGHTELFDAPPVLRLSRYVSKEYLEQVHWQSEAFKTVRAQLAVQQGFCVTIQGLLQVQCLLDCHALSCIVFCTEPSGTCLLQLVVMMRSLVPRTVRTKWSGRSRRCSSTMRPTSGSCPSETLRYNASAGEVLASKLVAKALPTVALQHVARPPGA